MNNVAAELDDNVVRIELPLCSCMQLLQRDFMRSIGQANDLGERVMAHAVRVLCVLDGVRRMVQPFKDESLSRQHGQTMQQLHRFLYLQTRNNGGDSRRSWDLPFRIVFESQQ